MSFPKTEKEWWAYFDRGRDDLRRLVADYHPARSRAPDNLPKLAITAPRAKAACADVREIIVANYVGDPLVVFDAAAKGRWAVMTLVNLLNETWFGIPESLAAHSLPGFKILCDLCSEADLVMPEGS